MSTSTAAAVVGACKAALVDGIGALAGFAAAEVPVSWSHPGATLEQSHAWIGGFRSTQKWATFGNRARDIDGPSSFFSFFILVVKPGGTAEEADTAALALLAEVETWLRTHETAGIDPPVALPGCKSIVMAVDRFDLSGGMQDEARWALVDVDISLAARI